jgi:hypothetical protein
MTTEQLEIKIDGEINRLKYKLWASVISLIIGLSGLAIIAFANWKIAIGLFLVLWGEGVSRAGKNK